jgi:Putative prokaryotic signal transducing protein
VSGISTVYLGQFTWEHANRIAEALEEAGITWWAKNPGTFSYVLFMEWGPRLFVDRSRLAEARDIAAAIAPDGLKKKRS